jgi:NAD(P)-dependent dehydrogenase (short-subunit alcohol dehydrogenase family)
LSRTALVTGGGSGIGRAVVERLAASDHRVVAVGRRAKPLEEAAAALDDVVAEVCDVADEQAVTNLFERIGPVDILVNSAGVSNSAPLARTTADDWSLQLDVNATGAFLCTRSVFPSMLERNWGRVVTVASTAGRVGHPYTAAYTASKHAAVGLSRVAATEARGTGVTANAVCPTFVRTPMTARSAERISDMTGRSPEDSEAELAGSSPLGRLLEPEEVAAAVAFLASDEAAAINGQTLVIDGGGIQP